MHHIYVSRAALISPTKAEAETEPGTDQKEQTKVWMRVTVLTFLLDVVAGSAAIVLLLLAPGLVLARFDAFFESLFEASGPTSLETFTVSLEVRLLFTGVAQLARVQEGEPGHD
jgi:hypothetical protein